MTDQPIDRRDGKRTDRRGPGRRGGRRSDDIPQSWLSITDYARVHGVGRDIVYKWLEASLLEYFRVDRVVRIKNQPPRQAPAERPPHISLSVDVGPAEHPID